jgi:L-asparaginase
MARAEDLTSPRVDVLALGGTIAMSGEAGVTPTLTSEELVAAVPGLADVAEVRARTFRQLPGASLRLDDLYELADEVERCLDAGATGVVITQGTDTIEETAFCLQLILDVSRPVVVTGAMRNPTLPGADGPANLHAGVVVAASQDGPAGVVVVLGDEVHPAHTVAKGHSTSPAAFRSPGGGPLGMVVEGRFVRFWRPAAALPTVSRSVVRPNVRVPIVTIGLDDDGALLGAVQDADAVVLEAMGVGHVPSWLVDPVAELARRMPVVMTTRTRSGPTLHQTYGFPGSERDLRSRGVMSVGLLDSIKTRILLMALLRTGAGADAISQALRRFDPLG